MESNFQNSSLNSTHTHDNKSIEELIDTTLLTNFEFDIAVLFYKVCKNEYKTISKQSKSNAKLITWYVFQNEKWDKESKKNILKKIESVLNNLYENKIDLLVIELDTIIDDDINYQNKINKKNKIQIAAKILNKLKKENFIKNIMKESAELFYSE
jgi:ribosomal protein S25